MLDVKEPNVRQGTSSRRSGYAVHGGKRVRPYATVPVAARATTHDAVSTGREFANQADSRSARRPSTSARPVPSIKLRSQAAPVAAPKRSRTVADRLARQEAKLLAAVVACTTVVCGLLVVYLAAYAQVASLGIQMSKARVELRKERLLGETLRAQVARAASPARISSAAVKNGMVLQRAEQICYVNPSDEPGFSTKPVNGTNSISTRTAQNDTTTGTTNEQADSRIARPESNASTGKNTGPRMASRGTITDTYTTASVAN